MKFLFDDDSFSFETLRTTGFANDFGPIWARCWPPPAGSTMATGRCCCAGAFDYRCYVQRRRW
jgi:hypothetical protein